MDLFSPTRRIAPDVHARITEAVIQRLGLDDDVTVFVTQLACSEPECPPLETVVAVLCGEGRRCEIKLHKPAAEVLPDDLVPLAQCWSR